MNFQVTIIFGLGFMSFCGGHFEFGLVIFIMSFLAAILNCNFRLRISGSNFRSPSWAFAVSHRYIFVCQMESHPGCTVHTFTVDLMLYHYPRRQPNIHSTFCVWIELQLLFELWHFKGFNCLYQIHNIGSILGHCLWRWPGIETLDKCIFIMKSRD